MSRRPRSKMAKTERALDTRPAAQTAEHRKPVRRGRPVGPAHLVTFVICVAGLFGAMRPSPDPDSWWHLATGRWIIDHASIPSTDPFSWTAAGKEWVAHEWASEIIFASVDAVFGAAGLLVMQGLFVGAALFILRQTLRRVVENEWIVAGSLVIAMYLSSLMWSLRPHLISLLFVVVFLDTLVAFRSGDGDRRIWLLIPLTVLWANLHAGFLSGVILVWVFTIVGLLERRADARRLLSVAALVTLAGAITPAGIEIYVFSVYLAQVSTEVAEWKPPGIRDPFGALVTAVAVGVPAIVALTKRRCDPALLVTAVLFGAMGVGAIRNIWLAGVLVAPALALALDGLGWIPRSGAAPRDRAFILTAHVLVLVAGSVLVWSTFGGRSESYLRGEGPFPKAASETLRELPAGRMLNPYGWGGYLIWKLPDIPVSIDGRADLYGYDLLDDALRVQRLKPGWNDYLDERGVDYVLWETETPLAEGLRLLDGWSVVYEDDEAVIFQRE